VNQDLIGRGWTFPIRVRSGRVALTDGPEKIRQSIWLILSTSSGERLMMPEFGCGIHDLVFQANTAELRGLVEEKVRESLLRWEPRIDVLQVRAETPAAQRNHLLIYIDYRIRAVNTLYNLVYPFFLQEGVI
jgi:uncharacterized protein